MSQYDQGDDNPNFKWIYKLTRDEQSYCTYGYSLQEWCDEVSTLEIKSTAITHAFKVGKLVKGFAVERIYKDDYHK